MGRAQGTFAVTQRLLARPSVLAPHSRVVVVGSQAHRRGTMSISSDLHVQGTPSNWCAFRPPPQPPPKRREDEGAPFE